MFRTPDPFEFPYWFAVQLKKRLHRGTWSCASCLDQPAGRLRRPGLAEIILNRYDLRPGEPMIIFSVSGVNCVPVEVATEIARPRTDGNCDNVARLLPVGGRNKGIAPDRNHRSRFGFDNHVPVGDWLHARSLAGRVTGQQHAQRLQPPRLRLRSRSRKRSVSFRGVSASPGLAVGRVAKLVRPVVKVEEYAGDATL